METATKRQRNIQQHNINRCAGVLGEQQLLRMEFSSTLPYCIAILSMYFPQHHNLRHPQIIFFPYGNVVQLPCKQPTAKIIRTVVKVKLYVLL